MRSACIIYKSKLGKQKNVDDSELKTAVRLVDNQTETAAFEEKRIEPP